MFATFLTLYLNFMTISVEKLLPLVDSVPEEYRGNAKALLDTISTPIEGLGDEATEWRAPYLRLLQATSKRAGLPKSAGPGSLILGETVLDGPVGIIPLRFWDNRQYWDSDPANARMLCNSIDAKIGFNGVECARCPKQVWVDGVGAECNKLVTAMVITEDFKHLFTLNFSKSGYVVGTEWKKKIRQAGCQPYQRIYDLNSETAKKAEIFSIKARDVNNPKRAPSVESNAFLKALYDQVTESRNHAVLTFVQAAVARRDTQPAPEQAMLASGADSTLQIATDVVDAKEVTSAAAKYSV